jgi:hypothetical protein
MIPVLAVTAALLGASHAAPPAPHIPSLLGTNNNTAVGNFLTDQLLNNNVAAGSPTLPPTFHVDALAGGSPPTNNASSPPGTCPTGCYVCNANSTYCACSCILANYFGLLTSQVIQAEMNTT